MKLGVNIKPCMHLPHKMHLMSFSQESAQDEEAAFRNEKSDVYTAIAELYTWDSM